MAELCCKVKSCVYNNDECCCKGDILVGGRHAKEICETACESFVDRNGNTYTSAMDHPSHTIQIDCEAEKCAYNRNYKCHADSVEIGGKCDSCCCGDTSCSTFRME